jgi:hypothetical protein
VYFLHPQPVWPLCEGCYRATKQAAWDEDRARYLELFNRDIGAFDPDAPRNRLPLPHACETCGREVAFGVRRRSRRAFCSLTCEREFRNAPRRVVNTPRPCKRPACPEVFIPARSDAEYHSAACKQRDYRRRLRETRAAYYY